MTVGLDPLLVVDVGWAEVGLVLLKAVIALAFLLIAVVLMIWFERKLIGDMQNRVGPNRAGPFGLLQTIADGVKLFLKEDLIPDRADRFVFVLAPFLSVVPAFVTFAVIPVGGLFDGGGPAGDGVIRIFGHDTYAQLADPPVGILLVLMASSISVYGVMLAGWSSGSKYPLLGSVRASAQMISYEAALGLSIVTVVLTAGSLSTHDIVASQAGDGVGGIVPGWNLIVTGFIPFVVFLIAGTAEINRPPFDLVEAEQEIVGGYHTEYSSIRFGLFYVAEFMASVTMSATIVTLFLGGPSGPSLFGPDFVWGPIWFLAKLTVFLFTFVWFRATLPRFRYDQLMDLGWKVLIPLSLAWLLLLAALQIGRDRDWNLVLVVGSGLGVAAIGYGLLASAMRTARRRFELEEANH